MNTCTDLIGKLNNANANCCVVLANLNKTSKNKLEAYRASDPFYTQAQHYTTFWKTGDSNFLFYDSINGLLSDVSERKHLVNYNGLIFGRGCSSRSLFFFDIPFSKSMKVPSSVQNQVRRNLNALADNFFLKVLMLNDCGLNVSSLQLFRDKEPNSKVYLENNLIEIRESNFRNPLTC